MENAEWNCKEQQQLSTSTKYSFSCIQKSVVLHIHCTVFLYCVHKTNNYDPSRNQ